MTTTQTAPMPPCPSCGSTNAVRIVYGEPPYEMYLASERGEIALGGCFRFGEAPDFECRGCGSALPWVAPDD